MVQLLLAQSDLLQILLVVDHLKAGRRYHGQPIAGMDGSWRQESRRN